MSLSRLSAPFTSACHACRTNLRGNYAVRGYARMARSRPMTPRLPTSRLTKESDQEPTHNPSFMDKPQTGSKSTSSLDLPLAIKRLKVSPEPVYDPNMVIFLDKRGNVTMIPHDDRVRESSPVKEGEVMNDRSEPFQRGSKEMEYARKRIGQVEIPNAIQDAIRSIVEGSDKRQIRTDALRLYSSLRSTGVLSEGDTERPTIRIKIGGGNLKAKEDKPLPAHILSYGPRESVAYIAAIAPTTYSAITNVLHEVHQRVPDLNPKSFLDFGTGPGTGIWAANDVWNTSTKYTGVDASTDMLATAEDILSSLSDQGTPMNNVSLRAFMSHGNRATKYDVVMSAFTLSEITSPEMRRTTLEQLWDSTEDMLILIDRGTPSGFRVIAEAREQILGLDKDLTKSRPEYDAYGNLLPVPEPVPRSPAHVLAPRKTKHSKENYEDAKYSYVVLRKGLRPVHTAPVTPDHSEASPTLEEVDSTATGGKKRGKKPLPPPPVTYEDFDDMFKASHSWPRLIVPPIKKEGHVVMDYCGSQGFLERMVIPRSQGKIPYRDARKAMWGDLFPHLSKNKPVQKEVRGGMGAKLKLGEDDNDTESETMSSPSTRKRQANLTPRQLLERSMNKEKKRNRQKITLDEVEGKSSRRKGSKNQDIVLEL
ncbi:37S ribosomal protein S22 [Lunasporangiospora selenospora]|uniref:37S ribosomal protein S22 n=1 Tax=Lunasporangiospora selenospora TaxID=979761 RepID=A0A9P6KIS6_9FUNG|nr:37S ribosomal protein S22 [Lunasporangiospora selenospora]